MPKISVLTALGFICAANAAHAADSIPGDLVAASFERIFTEEKNLPTPPSPASTGDDPLHPLFAATQENPHTVAGAGSTTAGQPLKKN